MRKFIAFAVFLAVVGGVGWRIYVSQSQTDSSNNRTNPPVAVAVGFTATGDIEDVSEFTGTLAGLAEVYISPKISGRIKAIHGELGDEFTQNQLIVTMDDDEARHAVAEARARLAVARANLDESETNLQKAVSEYERIQLLREKKIVAESELEAAMAAVASLEARKKLAEATIQQQEAALRSAEARLSYTTVTAPISGYIGKRYVDEGAMVSSSDPIVLLADIRTVKIRISVVEKDYSKIRAGLKARVLVDAYPEMEFKGVVTRIAPILDPNTRTADAVVEIDNPDALLKPGMFSRVYIRFGVHEGAVLVPHRTIVKRDGRMGVFVPSDDQKTARFTELSTGLSNETHVEVFGIKANQPLILTGQHLLNDGDPIAVTESNRL